ncbi:Glucose/Sorbosone dehydrogenase domain-containing protein [Plasmodiophora brassicae]|nr:hypothetical protein PBRA_001225 [Plasmodiophora brassicae]
MLKMVMQMAIAAALLVVSIYGDSFDKTLFTEQVVWKGVGAGSPTKMVVAPNGEVFVSDKLGKLVKYPSLTANAVNQGVVVWDNGADNTVSFGDRGFLSLAVDPAYPKNPYLWAIVSVNRQGTIADQTPVLDDPKTCPLGDDDVTVGKCDSQARLVRIKVNPATGMGVTDAILASDWCSAGWSHHVGDLVWAPDGGLYFSMGIAASYTVPDRGVPNAPCYRKNDARFQGNWDAQWDDIPAGKMFYIAYKDLTGNNLLTIGNGLTTVAKGLRNPFRFTVHPITYDLYIAEVGSDFWEEINVLPDPLSNKGKVVNFGWPCFEGNAPQPTYGADQGCANVKTEAVKPFFTYSRQIMFPDVAGANANCKTGSVSADEVVFVNNTDWGTDWENRLIWGDSSAQCLFSFANDPKTGLPDGIAKNMKLISYNPLVATQPTGIYPLNKWCDIQILTPPNGGKATMYAVNYDQAQLVSWSYVGPVSKTPVVVPTNKPGSNGGNGGAGTSTGSGNLATSFDIVLLATLALVAMGGGLLGAY